MGTTAFFSRDWLPWSLTHGMRRIWNTPDNVFRSLACQRVFDTASAQELPGRVVTLFRCTVDLLGLTSITPWGLSSSKSDRRLYDHRRVSPPQ